MIELTFFYENYGHWSEGENTLVMLATDGFIKLKDNKRRQGEDYNWRYYFGSEEDLLTEEFKHG